jgi:hypothetical protein
MRRAVLVGIALSSLITGEAKAYYFNANQLSDWCESYEHNNVKQNGSVLNAGLCVGYVGGVIDTLVDQATEFCVPQGPSGAIPDQLVDVVKLYLRDHPEIRHLPAANIVTSALKEKFPCNPQ